MILLNQKNVLINNIIEALYAKINFNLPKRTTIIYDFINSMNKIFLDDTIKNNTIKRSDYISKALLLLINKENFNNNFKWINYELFQEYIKEIKDKYDIYNEININNNNLDFEFNNINDNEKKPIKNEIIKYVGLKNLGLTCHINSNTIII